ncbi:TldD/PmbA family protein [Pyrofollis japonicus]|uniref:TldD/PmbA family protein n=1 Tax=Pyrofollis japonicus TaxID=3060460 RepID=UPI00295B5B49|nr:TldD/PmbA family protein [Pyrofollis japonicus]BEP18655.1 TldD/PmbA family protein [Pyrofollis japonicus]
MVYRIAPIELAVLAVRWAIREGATEAEAYVTLERGYKVSLRANKISSLEAVDDAGIGVRVAVGRRLGFSYATGLDENRVREAVREAVKQAKASPEDRFWSGLPDPSISYPEPGNMFSNVLAYTEPETVLENAKYMLSKALEQEGVQVVGGGIGVYTIERAITNSNGVYRIDSGTIAYAGIDILMKSEKVTTPAIYEIDSSRVTFPSIDGVVERALEKVKLCANIAKGVETGKYSVVLEPGVFYELLAPTVLYSLRGDILVQGRSYYAGKEGEQALSEKITIVDDGTLKGGDNTWRFDGEGVATSRKHLVEKGVVKGFIFDNYWGRRAGRESTGNAVRAGYASKPAPGYTNVIIEPGDAMPDELLEGKVLVVYQVQGAHTTNPDTGEYSVLANPAILYENGEPKGWVPGAVISGNMYSEVKNNIELVAKTLRKPFPGIYAPQIRLSNITVAIKS